MSTELSADWSAAIAYSKKSKLEAALRKSYWGDVTVTEPVQQKCRENEWFREWVRRSVAAVGKDLWNKSRHSAEMIDSKHPDVFMQDEVVKEGTPYRFDFVFTKDKSLILEVSGSYRQHCLVTLVPERKPGYVGEALFFGG